MNCPRSISADELARFWLDELPEREAVALEDHVFECAACDGSLRRFAAIAQGLRATLAMRDLPPLLTPAELAALRARGMRVDVEHLAPGATSKRPVDPSLDGLVWILHAELTATARVDLEICDPEGVRLLLLPDAPVDRDTQSVILACSRHTAEVAPASIIRLLDGATALAEYRLEHPAVESL
jgi:hypothetical protein